nr:hypothetical protein [Micromonospora sp. DSM 115978]
WRRIIQHPFVAAVADGSLSQSAGDRWIAEDHHFMLAFRRFMGGLVLHCKDPSIADLLSEGFAPLKFELTLFRRLAAERGVDLTRQANPATVSWASYLLNSLNDGFPTALTVLYAAERVYFEAWRFACSIADRTTPYWPIIENWSSDSYEGWVRTLGDLVAITNPDPSEQFLKIAFERVMQYELLFMNALFAGDSW